MRKDNQPEIIKRALEGVLGDNGRDSQNMVNKVLGVLDSQKLLRYSNNGDVEIFTTQGKVIMALIEEPKMTTRALSVYLDLSETMVARIIKSLVTAGVIIKTKYNHQNIYGIHYSALKNNPDIQHLSKAMHKILNNEDNSKVTEEDPF